MFVLNGDLFISAQLFLLHKLLLDFFSQVFDGLFGVVNSELKLRRGGGIPEELNKIYGLGHNRLISDGFSKRYINAQMLDSDCNQILSKLRVEITYIYRGSSIVGGDESKLKFGTGSSLLIHRMAKVEGWDIEEFNKY